MLVGLKKNHTINYQLDAFQRVALVGNGVMWFGNSEWFKWIGINVEV